jgi:DNA-directed RNA polymerase subunit RPC12/RpoP
MSYDDNQNNAVLLKCSLCGKAFYATHADATQKGWVCLKCRSLTPTS